MNTTFAEQAAEYLRQSQSGNNPLAPSTLDRYRTHLEAHLIPQMGPRRLQDINDATAKADFDLISAGLAPSTIAGIRNVFKVVMDSAVDSTGRQLFARKWNWKHIDLPAVIPAEQKAPEIPRKTLQEAILGGCPEDKLLWALLAGSGLRAGEALAVSTVPGDYLNVWNPDEKTVQVTGQQRPNGDLSEPKTASGVRTVDLSTQLNDFMLTHRPEGSRLFGTLYRGALDRLKNAVPSIPEIGFHSFRRFRHTHVLLNGAPEPLARYWEGHAAPDVHGRYAKWASQIEARREWAEKIGLGFELP